MKEEVDPQRQHTSPRFFAPSAEMIKALLEEAKEGPLAEDIQDVVEIFHRTGLRRSELCDLRWVDVDFDRRVITVDSGKTGRTRSIPVGERVLEILRARRERQGECVHVLGNSPRAVLYCVARQLRTLSSRALGRTINLRSFRHAFAMRWVHSGGDALCLAYVMGYASPVGTLKNLLSRDQLAAVAGRRLAEIETQSS